MTVGIDEFTVLMLHCNGSDTSTTFTDNSESSHTVTANGDAQIDTAQSVFGSASGLFDGTGDYLSISDHADWDFGTGDFTIDFHVRLTTLASDQDFISTYSSDLGFWLRFTSSNGLQFLGQEHGGTPSINFNEGGVTGWAADTWYHIALVRSGSDWYLFQDGTEVASTTGSLTMPNAVSDVNIGRNVSTTGAHVNGWMDEFRVSKGVARWSSAFTPPTSEYTSGHAPDEQAMELAIQAPSVVINKTVTPDALALELTLSDPTIEAVSVLTVNPTDDTYFRKTAPTSNWGTDTTMVVRDTSASNRDHAILRFDFSALGGIMISASLGIRKWTGSTGMTWQVCRLTETAWVETQATWNEYATSASWATGGGDYTTTDSATATVPANGEWMYWDVTDLVEYFRSNASSIADFLIKDDLENNSNTSAIFTSSEYATVSWRPTLDISYAPGAYASEQALGMELHAPFVSTPEVEVILPPEIDSYASEANSTTNYGTATTIYVAKDGGSGDYNVGLLKFDASIIPSGVSLISATLSLYLYAEAFLTYSSSVDFQVYRLTETGWTETGVTWDKYDGSTNWSGGIEANFTTTDGYVIETPSMPAINNWVDCDVLGQVQYALDSVSGIAHFFSRIYGPVSGVTASFYSSEYTGDTSLRPKLVVTFIVGSVLDEQAMELAIQAPTVVINKTVTLSVQAMEMALPAPSIAISQAFTLSALSLELTLEALTITSGQVIAASALSLELTMPAPSPAFDFATSVAAQAMEMSLEAPASVTNYPTVTPSAQAMEMALPAPSIEAGVIQVVSSALALELTMPAPSPAFDFATSVAAQAMEMSLEAPGFELGQVIATSTCALELTLEAPVVALSNSPTPSAQAMEMSLEAPASVTNYPTVTPSAQAMEFTAQAVFAYPMYPADVSGTLPMLTLEAVGITGDAVSAAVELPMLTLSIRAGLKVSLALPMFTLEASGTTETVGTMNRALPLLTLDGSGTSEALATFDKELPLLELTAELKTGGLHVFAADLPLVTLDAYGITGSGAGTLAETLPLLTLDAIGYNSDNGTFARLLPLFTLDAFGTSYSRRMI